MHEHKSQICGHSNERCGVVQLPMQLFPRLPSVLGADPVWAVIPRYLHAHESDDVHVRVSDVVTSNDDIVENFCQDNGLYTLDDDDSDGMYGALLTHARGTPKAQLLWGLFVLQVYARVDDDRRRVWVDLRDDLHSDGREGFAWTDLDMEEEALERIGSEFADRLRLCSACRP